MQDPTQAATKVKAATVPITSILPEPIATPLISVRNLNVWYGNMLALKGVTYDLFPREILAFIGPSGCGKTTALKCLDRMLDATRDIRIDGMFTMDGKDKALRSSRSARQIALHRRLRPMRPDKVQVICEPGGKGCVLCQITVDFGHCDPLGRVIPRGQCPGGQLVPIGIIRRDHIASLLRPGTIAAPHCG